MAFSGVSNPKHKFKAGAKRRNCTIEKMGFSNDKEGQIQAQSPELPPLTKTTERRLMAKIDWHIVPCLCVMYLLAFLDRYVPDTPHDCNIWTNRP